MVARPGRAPRRPLAVALVAIAAVALLAAACSSGSNQGGAGTSTTGAAGGSTAVERPLVVASTPLVGALVRSVGGEQVDVRVLGAADVDPAAALDGADLVVLIDAETYERGLGDLVARARELATPVVALAPQLNPIPLGGSELDPGSSDATGATDPHVWLDPDRWTQAARLVGTALADLDGVDPTAVQRSVAAFDESVARTDETVQATFAVVPADRRALVGDLPALGYLADRYGFDLVLATDPAAMAGAAAGRGVTTVFTAPDHVDELASSLAAIDPGLTVVGLDVDATAVDPAALDLTSATAAYISLLVGAADAIAAAAVG